MATHVKCQQPLGLLLMKDLYTSNDWKWPALAYSKPQD